MTDEEGGLVAFFIFLFFIVWMYSARKALLEQRKSNYLGNRGVSGTEQRLSHLNATEHSSRSVNARIGRGNSDFERHSALIKEFQSQPVPYYILCAMRDFEESYQVVGSSLFHGRDFSPLKYYGYTVGKTNGLKSEQRQRVIIHTYHAVLPDIFPEDYRRKWGNPGTYRRYSKILRHIEVLAERNQYKHQMRYAVSDWQYDSRWLYENYSQVAYERKACGLEN